jgi:hypothetical protein
MTLLFWLLVGHSLCDFGLQGELLVRGKNRHVKPTYIPPGQTVQRIWPYCLSAHALMHAGAVALVTGSLTLGLLEFVLHWLIDFAKCEAWTTTHSDQALHVVCKIAWAVIT